MTLPKNFQFIYNWSCIDLLRVTCPLCPKPKEDEVFASPAGVIGGDDEKKYSTQIPCPMKVTRTFTTPFLGTGTRSLLTC